MKVFMVLCDMVFKEVENPQICGFKGICFIQIFPIGSEEGELKTCKNIIKKKKSPQTCKHVCACVSAMIMVFAL